MELMPNKTFSYVVHCDPKTSVTWVKGLCCAVDQTDVYTAEMDDVVQSCYHQSPYCNNQSHHNVDHKQQVRQEEQTLPESHHEISETTTLQSICRW